MLTTDGHNLIDLLAEKVKVVVFLNKAPFALLVDGLAFANCRSIYNLLTFKDALVLYLQHSLLVVEIV